MNFLPFIKVYLAINILLMISYLAFSILYRANRIAAFRLGYRQWILLARTIFAVSFLVPVMLPFMPKAPISSVGHKIFQPLPEGETSTTFLKGGASKRQVQGTDQIPSAPPRSGFFAQAMQWLNSDRSAASLLFFALAIVLGSIFSFALTVSNTARLRTLLRSGTVVRAIARTKVVISDEITIPFSAWMGRTNWIALPSSIIRNRRDFWLALKHELQHHRHGDTRWTVLLELMVCVFFANPAIYLWRRKINELHEFSCDEALLGQKGISFHEYGSCLLRVAEAALKTRQLYAGTTCMSAAFKDPSYAKSFLRRRIEMFANHKIPRTRKWKGVLAGVAGTFLTVAFAFGTERAMRRDQTEVNPGILAVNPIIQGIAERVLKGAVRVENAKSGFAIVADPNTGKILAVASVDTTGKLPKNWVLGQVLEPASFAKILVAAQAIESGLTTPQESHNCENGSYKFADRVYHDWKTGGWDHLTTEDAVAISSDICTMKIGEKVGADGLYKMLVNFGFGPEGTAKTFPTARSGDLPPVQSPHWPEMVPAVSAGYGFKASPVELVQAYGAIANGGNLLMPKTVDENSAPQFIRQVLSPASADITREILRQVVLKGTAKGRVSSELYSTAGKTATSYIPDLTQWTLVEGEKKGNFAGFIGFAPVKSPRIEVYVGILDPDDGTKSGAHGSAHAAPVFTKIIEEVLLHMNVAPDKI